MRYSNDFCSENPLGSLGHVDCGGHHAAAGRALLESGHRAVDGRVADGGGRHRPHRGGGHTYLHVAVDDYSRVDYVEAHDDETTVTLAGFWTRAQDWFWSNDMAVDAVMTDNGANFCSGLFAELLARR